MPKADATGLAPKKSADDNPPALRQCGRVVCVAFPPLSARHADSAPSRRLKKQAHFFGETSERRPWAQNATTARPPLPGVPYRSFFFRCRDTAPPYTSEY